MGKMLSHEKKIVPSWPRNYLRVADLRFRSILCTLSGSGYKWEQVDATYYDCRNHCT